MPEKIEREVNDDSLEQELERERREHALIDEEKLGMDELEEERLKRERQPGGHERQGNVISAGIAPCCPVQFRFVLLPSPGGP